MVGPSRRHLEHSTRHRHQESSGVGGVEIELGLRCMDIDNNCLDPSDGGFLLLYGVCGEGSFYILYSTRLLTDFDGLFTAEVRKNSVSVACSG